MASAWATLITYLVIALLSYFYGKKYYSIPYPLKKIGVSLLFALTGSYLSFIFYRGNYLVSTALILAFLAITFWTQKSEIKQLWKT
jgi:CHASE2 domain-containing sensor protein